MDIKKALGANVRTYRNKLNLTQEQLAETSGVAYKYIQKIEGKSTPNVGITLLEKLAKALKISPSQLINSR